MITNMGGPNIYNRDYFYEDIAVKKRKVAHQKACRPSFL